MVQSIDTLTLAGQRHELKKIVALLEDEIISGCGSVCTSRAEAIDSLLGALRQEASRLLPDVTSFVARAEALITFVENAP